MGVPLLVRDSVSRGFTHSCHACEALVVFYRNVDVENLGAPIDGLVAAVRH